MEASDESVSPSEEHENEGVHSFEDSSEESSEDLSQQTLGHTQRGEDIDRKMGRRRKGKFHRRPPNQRKTFKKTWPKRRSQARRMNRKFRNPHGSKVQIPHPPPTGRWQRVWQRFNQSKPAQAGRWAAMYNRTRGYWNRVKNRLEKRISIRDNNGKQNDSDENISQNIATANYSNFYYHHHNHSHHWRPHNHTHHNHTHHHWHPRNHTHKHHPHHWHPRNLTQWRPNRRNTPRRLRKVGLKIID